MDLFSRIAQRYVPPRTRRVANRNLVPDLVLVAAWCLRSDVVPNLGRQGPAAGQGRLRREDWLRVARGVLRHCREYVRVVARCLVWTVGGTGGGTGCGTGSDTGVAQYMVRYGWVVQMCGGMR